MTQSPRDRMAVIYLLMGPKGAGKTYLATRMEEELSIPFLRVEPIWLALSSEMSPGTQDFDAEGQQRVLSQAQILLGSHDRIVLESTGTAPWFLGFLKQLQSLGNVTLIRVRVPLSLCLERIHARDSSRHIPVSDDRIAEINQVADQLELPWSAVVDNSTSTQADEFLRALRSKQVN